MRDETTHDIQKTNNNWEIVSLRGTNFRIFLRAWRGPELV